MVRLRTIGPQRGSYRSNTCLFFSAVGSYVVVLRAVAVDHDTFRNIFRFRSTKALFSNLHAYIYIYIDISKNTIHNDLFMQADAQCPVFSKKKHTH